MAAKLKTIFAASFALVAGGVLLPPPPPEQHHPHRIPIRFWHMWTAEWQVVVEKICKRFNDSQDKYEVIPLSIPSDGAETKFLLSAGGGETPDLVSQWNPILGMWVDRGLVRPVEELMTPQEKADYLKNAFPIMKKYAVYRGKITAIIAGVDVSALYYRMDHLKEVGVDKDHLPQSLEELMALGRKLDRYDAQKHLRRVGFLPAGWVNYCPPFGGSINRGGETTLQGPENLRALQFIFDASKRLGFDNVTRFQSSQAADTGVNIPLIAGNYSIMLDGQWRVKQADQYAPNLDYLIAPLPPPKGGKPMASFTAANYMLIPRAAKHPEGAYEFLKFWVGIGQPEHGGMNTADMGWLPYCPDVANSKTYQAYLHRYPRFKTFVDLMSSPNLETPPVGPLQSFVMDEVTKIDESTSRGTKTPKEAIDEAVAHIEAERKRQRSLGNEG